MLGLKITKSIAGLHFSLSSKVKLCFKIFEGIGTAVVGWGVLKGLTTGMKREGIEGVWLGRRGLLYLSFYLSKFGSLKLSRPWWQHHQIINNNMNKQSPEPKSCSKSAALSIEGHWELLQGGFSHQLCSSRKGLGLKGNALNHLLASNP